MSLLRSEVSPPSANMRDCGCFYIWRGEHGGSLFACPTHEADLQDREKGPFLPYEEVFAALRAKWAESVQGCTETPLQREVIDIIRSFRHAGIYPLECAVLDRVVLALDGVK